MTESEVRKMYVDRAISFFGAVQGDAQHKEIVDTYNSYLPHPRGYTLKMTDPWCAPFVSACAILTDLSDIVPIECSCSEQIKMLKNNGRWEERDDYVPSPGDLIYYDWDDNGKGDCTGAPEHVGIVVKTDGGMIQVIEGNKGSAHVVGYRDISVNGQYIRGFGLPKFSSKAATTMVCCQILKRGSKGEAVKSLQTLLNFRLGSRLDIDGSFGPKTLIAVNDFQKKCLIEVDGSVGPITWGRLING